MIKFKLENYHKPKPKHWKAIGDTALYSIPIIDSIFMGIPDFEGKEWLIWGWSLLAAMVKIATKYISDVEEEQDEDKD